MIEKFRHHRQPAAMRQPVGVESDQNGAANGKKTEPDPGAHQRRQLVPCRIALLRLGVGQPVDNAAEQHRLDELRAGQSQIGEDQR